MIRACVRGICSVRRRTARTIQPQAITQTRSPGLRRRVAAAHNVPAARFALVERTYQDQRGTHQDICRSGGRRCRSLRWQANRGVLNPLDASPPGSVWWRAALGP
jgi:hypothetical protein